jgi:hypothetical protein
MPSFILVDQHIGAAINSVATFLRHTTITGFEHDLSVPSTPQALRHVSVDLGNASVLDALNATVRHNGTLVWEILYCKPVMRFEFATIWLRTFDNWAKGFHSGTLNAHGTFTEGCYPRTKD